MFFSLSFFLKGMALQSSFSLVEECSCWLLPPEKKVVRDKAESLATSLCPFHRALSPRVSAQSHSCRHSVIAQSLPVALTPLAVISSRHSCLVSFTFSILELVQVFRSRSFALFLSLSLLGLDFPFRSFLSLWGFLSLLCLFFGWSVLGVRIGY